MMEMPARTGRRIQDAARRMREGFHRSANERQQVNSLHRQRMTCSDRLNSFANTQDWTGGMGMSPSGRFQVIEEARPKQKIISRKGIRWNAAWAMLAAVVFLCAAVLLADLAGMGLSSRSISRLENKIEDLARRNEVLKQELSISAGDANVCTEAVKLNLISAYGATPITLTAPQEWSSGAVSAEVQSASAGWMTGGLEN